jgi:hypothetical protein
MRRCPVSGMRAPGAEASAPRPRAPVAAPPAPTQAVPSSPRPPSTARSPGGADGRVRQAQPVGGGLLRPGDENRSEHADLTVRGALSGAGRPSRHALRTRSQGSGGSARRMVNGRSLVAGPFLSPRPEPRAGGRGDRLPDLEVPVQGAALVLGARVRPGAPKRNPPPPPEERLRLGSKADRSDPTAEGRHLFHEHRDELLHVVGCCAIERRGQRLHD